MLEQPNSIKNLETKTQEFFRLHWNQKIHGNHFPEWEKWNFEGPIPNNGSRGCYALVNENKIIEYIGVGLGKSVERYYGSGLGDRLKNYYRIDKLRNKQNNVKSIEDRFYMRREKWINEILTIGFPHEVDYLAAALEIFLIKELKPIRNRQMK